MTSDPSPLTPPERRQGSGEQSTVIARRLRLIAMTEGRLTEVNATYIREAADLIDWLATQRPAQSHPSGEVTNSEALLND